MYYLKISDLPSCDGIQKKLRFDHKITIKPRGAVWQRVSATGNLG